MNSQKPYLITIIGRPNVGKSTLFNRLLKEQKALVAKESGLTRDYQQKTLCWGKYTFELIDTSGFDIIANDPLRKAMDLQYERILLASDALIFVCDGQTPLTQLDEELLHKMRTYHCPMLFVVNKMDTNFYQKNKDVFYRFFGKDFLPISAEKGEGIGRLLTAFEKQFFLPKTTHEKKSAIRTIPVAILGRPNVGKSSLVNALLGFERCLVSPVAGTTRDAIDLNIEYGGHHFVFIDTAGLRKKSKITSRVEKISTQAAIKTLERSEVVLLVVDATQGFTDQDLKIVDLAWQRATAVILLINKWDLLPSDKKTNTYWERQMAYHLRHFNRLPYLFISATEKRNIQDIFKAILEVKVFYDQVVDAAKLRTAFYEWTQTTPHPLICLGKYRKKVKWGKIAQRHVSPPEFKIETPDAKKITTSYDRFLKNKIREHYGLWGIPISIAYRPPPVQ
ncbi:MAG: ribosome biogenesis GTPase Der [Deltaproteobacteria bacterium]|nr:ribosome biogenesis GTPase Der [Deltaproteobacteria bacterium]